MQHYTCFRELVPTITSALAATGYTLEALPQNATDNGTLTMLVRDATVVALREHGQHPLAEITLFGLAAEDTLALFDGLARLLPPALQPDDRTDSPAPFRRIEKVASHVWPSRTER